MVCVAEEAAEQHAQRTVFMQRARPVQRHGRLPVQRIDLPQVPNACFVQCAERSGKQTGGNKNQENTGDAEKPS